MPVPPMDEALIKEFAEAFSQYDNLTQNGFAFLIDVSGRLHKDRSRVSLKDVEANIEAGKKTRHASLGYCKKMLLN